MQPVCMVLFRFQVLQKLGSVCVVSQDVFALIIIDGVATFTVSSLFQESSEKNDLKKMFIYGTKRSISVCSLIMAIFIDCINNLRRSVMIIVIYTKKT